MIDFSAYRPISAIVLAASALLAASFAWAWLARFVLGRIFRRRANAEMLAGLIVCGPALCLALVQALQGQPRDAAPVGAASAITYMLLAPVLLLRHGAERAWMPWRRAVLPFLLTASVMWFIIVFSGTVTPLEGQFLITLLVLGSWLFSLDRPPQAPAQDNKDTEPEAGGIPAPSLPDQTRPAGLVSSTLVQPQMAQIPVAQMAPVQAGSGLQAATVIGAAIVAAVLSLWGAILLSGSLPAAAVSAMPLVGVIVCVGPISMAIIGSRHNAGAWLGTLGYAAMAGFCLVPGVAAFLQLSPVSNPLYAGDAAIVALSAAFLLGLDANILGRGKSIRWVAIGGWALWVLWVVVSAIPG